MNKKHILSAAVLLLGLLSSTNIDAQPYDKALRRNFWNDGSAWAGIRNDSISISYAQLDANYVAGEYKDVSDAASQWSIGATAATIMHLKSFSMKGSFTFRNTQLYDACGSIFLNPGYFPIDAYEFTPGKKSRQDYSFSGGASVDVGQSLRLAAGLDFHSTNIAKFKDLRHTGYALDLKFSPGIQYHNDVISVGLCYIFSRKAETETAEQIGTKETYNAFLDKGLMFGVEELWNGSGVHLSEAGVNGLPLQENANGLGLQFSAKGFYADFEYQHSNGQAGEKQFIWYRFPSDRFGLHLGYSINDRHYLRLAADFRNQSNNETSIEKVSTGGVTTVKEIGSNQILGRNIFNLRPEYRYESDKLELMGSLFVSGEKTCASVMYPYLCTRNFVRYGGSASALFHTGRWSLGLLVDLSKGNCDEQSSLVSTTSGVTSNPYRLEDWNAAHLKYLTEFACGIAPSVRYTFPLGLYLQFGGRALISYAFRGDVGLSFGYNF